MNCITSTFTLWFAKLKTNTYTSMYTVLEDLLLQMFLSLELEKVSSYYKNI